MVLFEGNIQLLSCYTSIFFYFYFFTSVFLSKYIIHVIYTCYFKEKVTPPLNYIFHRFTSSWNWTMIKMFASLINDLQHHLQLLNSFEYLRSTLPPGIYFWTFCLKFSIRSVKYLWTRLHIRIFANLHTLYPANKQGSQRPWNPWKTLEFFCPGKPWKTLEFNEKLFWNLENPGILLLNRINFNININKNINFFIQATKIVDRNFVY